MVALTLDLREAFQEKTESLHAVLIEVRDSDLFSGAIAILCGSTLHADLSISEEELILAGRALALGLSTAAVSHAMRSVEASLHVLAHALGIAFPAPVQLQDWMTLTDKIKAEISTWEKYHVRHKRSKNYNGFLN